MTSMGQPRLSLPYTQLQLPARRRRFVPCSVLVMSAVLIAAAPAQAARPKLKPYYAKHYAIQTALTRDETGVLARHMDRVFEAYQRKFSRIGLQAKKQKPMEMYLFRTRKQYVRFMAEQKISAANTAGMFFYLPNIRGLATFTQDRSVTETCAVLQHEGFHQFAFHYIGPKLPIWVNEGLAQYFEDGILVRGKLHLDMANARRIKSVKDALSNRRAIQFERMLSISESEWSEVLKTDPDNARLLYDQAWSMVFFLATAENGRYVQPFRQYLRAVADGSESGEAFRRAFGAPDMELLEREWHRFALAAEPDATNIAITRLTFLGQALQFMFEKKIPVPDDIDELRRTLRKVEFRMTQTSHGLTTEYLATDDSLYRYPIGRNGSRQFQLLGRARDDLPPRITAQGMKPEPTLAWSRDAEGKLVQDVVFK